MWLMMVQTLPVASRRRNGLRPILVVVLSTQVVQVPVKARRMTLDFILGHHVGQREDTAYD